MDSARKKELKEAYKKKPARGGVCSIRCNDSGREWIKETRDIEGLRSRFNFAVMTKTSPEPSMRDDWEKYGIESFSFVVLDELTKKEDQTDIQYNDELHMLYKLRLENSRAK